MVFIIYKHHKCDVIRYRPSHGTSRHMMTFIGMRYLTKHAKKCCKMVGGLDAK